ncbi:hypothetical protein GTO10_01360 [Candidatus Saccharibacteria bacterium]|nr:hypothetical protein [Candidatus Saccharibacteria bacterium]
MGSGISLGVGFVELRKDPDTIQFSGFQEVSADNHGLAQSESNPLEERININAASASKLELLPGIGTVKAQAVVEYREKIWPFSKRDRDSKRLGRWSEKPSRGSKILYPSNSRCCYLFSTVYGSQSSR